MSAAPAERLTLAPGAVLDNGPPCPHCGGTGRAPRVADDDVAGPGPGA